MNVLENNFQPVDVSGYASKGGDFWSSIFDNLIGVGTGGLSGLISSLFGSIFNIGCWGSQAFDKGALEQQMGYIREEYNRITSPSDLVNVNRMLGGVNYIRYKFEKAITQYKNACSKQLATELVNVCKTLVNSVLPLYEYYTKAEEYDDVVEGHITVIQTIVTSLKDSSTTTLPGIPTPGSTGTGGTTPTPTGTGNTGTSDYNPSEDYLLNRLNGLPSTAKGLLQTFAQTEGVSIQDVLQGYFVDGSIRIVDGKVVWSASAGNQQEDNTMTNLIVFGVLGFLGYKLIKK